MSEIDATKRPFKIDPAYLLYSEKHGLFDLYQRLIQKLVTHKPDDPLKFLIETLKQESDDVPAVIIIGPPASGKFTLAKMLASRLRCPHLTLENIIKEANRETKLKIEGFLSEGQSLPVNLWLTAVQQRLAVFDCVKRGWVMSGMPDCREQALALQSAGIFPNHMVVLTAPDEMLIERAQGKRVDPDTGDIYHSIFSPPADEQIAERLIEVSYCSPSIMPERLQIYARSLVELTQCYSASIIKQVNADQPLADAFAQVLQFVSCPARSCAPRTPRIVLLGTPGAGKSTQAALLAVKYNLVAIHCAELLREQIAEESKLGLAVKNYVEKKMPVPDTLLLQILKNRLSQLDCASRGWILWGYPRSRDQAEQLAAASLAPNRVFFFEISNFAIMDRLTNRMLDQVTGDRYHSVVRPPSSSLVNQNPERLLTHPRDDPTDIERRLVRCRAFQEELMDYYKGLVQIVDADQDVQTVFELCESFLVKSLPKQEM